VALAFEECSQAHRESVSLARKRGGMEVLKGAHTEGEFIFDILINRKPAFTYGVEHDPMWLMATRIQKFHVEINAEEVFARACYFVATGYPYRYATYLDAMCPGLCSPGVRCLSKGGGVEGNCTTLVIATIAYAADNAAVTESSIAETLAIDTPLSKYTPTSLATALVAKGVVSSPRVVRTTQLAQNIPLLLLSPHKVDSMSRG
jgi:hypothetical protein